MIRITASSLERAMACPGSYWAEKGIVYEQSPAAAEGDLLHAAMEGKTVRLTREQQRAVEWCRERAQELLVKFEIKIPGGGQWRKEMFSAWGSGAAIISMKLDFLAWSESVALVLDYKFGRGDVPPAPINPQLRAYVLAAAKECGVTRVVVAILQPYAEFESRVSVCEYGPEDIAQAGQELLSFLGEMLALEKSADYMRIPGEAQCKYCKALGTDRCPESRDQAAALSLVKLAALMPTGATLAKLLDQAAIAEKVIGVVRDHARAEITEGHEVPGWTLTAGRNVREISDLNEAWNRLSGILAQDQFVACCKGSITALEDAYATATGKRGKDLKESFAAVLGSALGVSQQKGSLKKV
jgi:uncharacterized protein DUF2800